MWTGLGRFETGAVRRRLHSSSSSGAASGRSQAAENLMAASGTKCQNSPTLQTVTRMGAKVARQRDIADSANEKWFLKAHSQAKHQILHGYLGAWLAILGQVKRGNQRLHRTLMLIDGFA